VINKESAGIYPPPPPGGPPRGAKKGGAGRWRLRPDRIAAPVFRIRSRIIKSRTIIFNGKGRGGDQKLCPCLMKGQRRECVPGSGCKTSRACPRIDIPDARKIPTLIGLAVDSRLRTSANIAKLTDICISSSFDFRGPNSSRGRFGPARSVDRYLRC